MAKDYRLTVIDPECDGVYEFDKVKHLKGQYHGVADDAPLDESRSMYNIVFTTHPDKLSFGEQPDVDYVGGAEYKYISRMHSKDKHKFKPMEIK